MASNVVLHVSLKAYTKFSDLLVHVNAYCWQLFCTSLIIQTDPNFTYTNQLPKKGMRQTSYFRPWLF